ncbi:flagellar hook-associated protein FlgL [Marisediminicola antarctica]|uniref:Flagellin n=1 Tax=Marisediminicola antarctica TaxID=674079 RepID=A0A7L5AJY7_9MICO|nr:flagellin [Marisediminicola antarctica]QHO68609.1 flagellar hook-associated protein 3 [Marisediminicola antarctica]
MISRVTTQTMVDSAARNLQSAKNDLARIQDRASSQKALDRPSDDPAAMAESLRVRTAQRATEQYGSNIADGMGWLATTESALSGALDVLGRVRDLTVQGANDGALSTTARNTIALELESLGADLLSKANSSYLGRSVFAGTSDAGVAFDAGYAHTGAPGSSVQRRVGDDQTVRVDVDGAAAFGTGPLSAFALIDGIAADLRAGVNIGTRLSAVDARITAVVEQLAGVGTRDARIERAQEANMEHSGALEAQRSGVEDIDLARVILDLQVQETTYRAALAVTARVLQPTLMDFLR